MGADSPTKLDTTRLRDLAAAFTRAAARRSRLALVIGAVDAGPEDAARALTEGAALARYRYTPLKSASKHTLLRQLALHVAGVDPGAVIRGSSAGLIEARATVIARDLANTPPGHLTATDMGEVAVELGARFGFQVELFDKQALIGLGCGGLLGVNQGSVEEPRMIKLSYTPEGAATGHLGLVGKGIMYDSGGISLKPSDPMHLLMKMDMGGAAAVLGAFTALRDTGVQAKITGWLMCTDNMPSGTAYKLGDVLVARGGTTVEVKNTDAEGRLVMMDALVLANEARVDAVIDIATRTGAALMALGTSTAPVFANDQRVADLALAASAHADEQLWQLPLEQSTVRSWTPTSPTSPTSAASTPAPRPQPFSSRTSWATPLGSSRHRRDDADREGRLLALGRGHRLRRADPPRNRTRIHGVTLPPEGVLTANPAN